jgi:hypothetical protein
VAVLSLVLVAPGAANAQTLPPAAPCNTVSGTTVTCTGNVSTGVLVNYGSSLRTLNVNTLTANITPASGVNGIRIVSDTGAVTVNSNTGAFSISTTGGGAGIDARASGSVAGGEARVYSIGDITSAGGRGI